MSFVEIIKTEDNFWYSCSCSSEIFKFVDDIPSDARWFFDTCYADYHNNIYHVIFKSYITEEYKNYILSVKAEKINNDWNINLVKKVDGLKVDNV